MLQYAQRLGCGLGFRSVVIVPPEVGLESPGGSERDSEMCWCFIRITVRLFSGTTQRSVIESYINLPHMNESCPI